MTLSPHLWHCVYCNLFKNTLITDRTHLAEQIALKLIMNESGQCLPPGRPCVEEDVKMGVSAIDSGATCFSGMVESQVHLKGPGCKASQSG